MRLTEAALRKIVREECVRALFENNFPDNPGDMTPAQFKAWMSSISPLPPKDPEEVRRANREQDKAVSEHDALEAEQRLINFGGDDARNDNYLNIIAALADKIRYHLSRYGVANFSVIGKDTPDEDLTRLVTSARTQAAEAREEVALGGDSSIYNSIHENQKGRWSRRR